MWQKTSPGFVRKEKCSTNSLVPFNVHSLDLPASEVPSLAPVPRTAVGLEQASPERTLDSTEFAFEFVNLTDKCAFFQIYVVSVF